MIRRLLARLNEWIALEEPDDRIEGSGEAILSPQHRRNLEAERELERLESEIEKDRRERR